MRRSRAHLSFTAMIVPLIFGQMAFSAVPWSKNPEQWTPQDVAHILADSPWAKQGSAKFPPVLERDESPGSAQSDPDAAGVGSRAGMPLPGGKIGHWDGGVGRDPGAMPTLPVMVRWDSALPMREALERSGDADQVLARSSKDYIITVLGLWPGSKSNSAEPASLGHMREALLASTQLLVKGQKPLAPEDVTLDGKTGALHFFFSRANPITGGSKEAVFRTEVSSMRVSEKFRLKDMTVHGQLQL